MSFQNFSMLLTGVGALCLILDLGNRVFGGYARNLWRTGWRILAVIAAGMLPILLLAGALATEGTARTAFFALSNLFAGAAIMIFLFPPRHGIVREPARRTTISACPCQDCFSTRRPSSSSPLCPMGCSGFSSFPTSMPEARDACA